MSSVVCKASGLRRCRPGRKPSGGPQRPPARGSCGWRLPESVQCLSVTEKYRDHLAAPGQDDNLTFMGYRGTEGSRTPADWHGQRSGRPRSYSARPATEPGDGGSGTPGGPGASPIMARVTTKWDTAPANGTLTTGAALTVATPRRVTTRPRAVLPGFSAGAGQPDPVYPHDDFEAWSDSTGAAAARPVPAGPRRPQGQWGAPTASDEWDSGVASGEWDAPTASGEREGPAAGGPPDVPAAGAHGTPLPSATGSPPATSEHREGGEHWDAGRALGPGRWPLPAVG